jgi:hypothetical protein
MRTSSRDSFRRCDTAAEEATPRCRPGDSGRGTTVVNAYAGGVITTYEVEATDLVTAIAVATRRANNDGYPRASVVSSVQTGTNSWTITMFLSQ